MQQFNSDLAAGFETAVTLKNGVCALVEGIPTDWVERSCGHDESPVADGTAGFAGASDPCAEMRALDTGAMPEDTRTQFEAEFARLCNAG